MLTCDMYLVSITYVAFGHRIKWLQDLDVIKAFTWKFNFKRAQYRSFFYHNWLSSSIRYIIHYLRHVCLDMIPLAYILNQNKLLALEYAMVELRIIIRQCSSDMCPLMCEAWKVWGLCDTTVWPSYTGFEPLTPWNDLTVHVCFHVI